MLLGMMALTVEIIDFTRPVVNSKNLFVTNIKTNEMNEGQITSALWEASSAFGLVYEVQVFPVKRQTFGFSARQTGTAVASYYAFVKFYSRRAAQQARRTLNNSLKLGTLYCKVCNAKRCKETDEGKSLYMSDCQELANHYLGFNGWTSSIRRLEQDHHTPWAANDDDLEGPRVRFFCVVDLTFPCQGLSSHGIGAWEERYCLQDATSKATAIHKARKRSYQRALEHAFDRVLLVVVNSRDGKVKVTVEVDTTRPDELTEVMQERIAQEQVLTVNEVTEAPCEDDDNDDDNDDNDDNEEGSEEKKKTHKVLDHRHTLPDDIDDANLHILQELVEGGGGGGDLYSG